MKEGIKLYEIVSSLIKYIFITIIYLFIFAIIRMIYLDIRSMNAHMPSRKEKLPYLKLISYSDELDTKVEESYVLQDKMTIGHNPDNNIEVADQFLSGTHAMFMRQDGGYLLKDLGSTNGTFVNDVRLADMPVRLKDGDKISMGRLNFMYVAGMEAK
jgi:Ni,Fe-hydrogenase I cytochrome b subunit